MEAASPVCRWLFAVGLVALAGCQTPGSSETLNARGQAPGELPAPLSPASLPPVIPPQPMPPAGPVTPLQPMPPVGPVTQPVPSGSGPVVPSGPVQGLPVNSNVAGGAVQGFPVNSGVAGGSVQGFPINPGPITPVAMVVPSSNRPNVEGGMNLPRESIPQIGNSIPQVKVMAQVGSFIITDQEVVEAIHMRLEELRDLTGPAREDKEKKIYHEELWKLIERELLIDDVFTRLKKNKKPTDEIKEIGVQAADERLRDIRNQQGARTEEEFIRGLRAQGLTLAGLRRKIERETMAEIYVHGVLKDTARNPGFCHMRVFMAGANTTGLAVSHARQTHVRQLSHRPTASFASVFASSGAMTNTSAHFRNSMCSTVSPRSYQSPASRPGHSSASRITMEGSRFGGTGDGGFPRSSCPLPTDAGSKKYVAASVATILTA